MAAAATIEDCTAFPGCPHGAPLTRATLEGPRQRLRSTPTSETAIVWRLLREARRGEQLAGLPKLEGGLWHPYRRLWAVERKHLSDVDVAKAGGWRDLATMKRSYQRPDPATVLRVIENAAPMLELNSVAR